MCHMGLLEDTIQARRAPCNRNTRCLHPHTKLWHTHTTYLARWRAHPRCGRGESSCPPSGLPPCGPLWSAQVLQPQRPCPLGTETLGVDPSPQLLDGATSSLHGSRCLPAPPLPRHCQHHPHRLTQSQHAPPQPPPCDHLFAQAPPQQSAATSKRMRPSKDQAWLELAPVALKRLQKEAHHTPATEGALVGGGGLNGAAVGGGGNGRPPTPWSRVPPVPAPVPMSGTSSSKSSNIQPSSVTSP